MDRVNWRILLIDDDEDDFFLARGMLSEARSGKFSLEWAESFEAGQAALLRENFDAVLVDYLIGVQTGTDFIRQAIASGVQAPFILLTGQGSYEVDVEAMQAGAFDYLNKSELNPAILERSIRYAIERKRYEIDLAQAKQQLELANAGLEAANAALEETNQSLRASEEALRESEGRFRIALSNASIAVFSTDRDLRYNWFYSNAMGSLPEQFLGKLDDEIQPDGGLEELKALKRQALEQQTPIRDEIHVLLNGGPKTMIASVEPYFNQAGQVIGVIGACIDVTEQRRLEMESIEHHTEMEVQRRLMEYREKERQEIARDLHDGPVQDLSSTIFNIQCVLDSIESPQTRLEIEQIRSNVKKSVHDLRGMINELRPPALIRFGLGRAIQFHAEDFPEKHPQIQLNLDLDEEENGLPEKVSLALFRIYQEALANIVRHARADQVWVRFARSGGYAVLEIRDNGVGFEVPGDLMEHTEKGHFGLAGMKERAETIGGTFQVEAKANGGTTIQVRVPIKG